MNDAAASQAAGTTRDTLVFVAPRVVADAPAGDVQAQLARAFDDLRADLGERSCTLDDVVRIWSWVASRDAEDAVVAGLTEVFPDRGSRPVVTVLVKPENDAPAVQLECIAVRGGARRSVYLDGPDAPLPSGVAKGAFFCVGALTGQQPGTGELASEGVEQAEQALRRVGATVAELGGGPDNIGHVAVWYTDHSMRNVVNEPFVRMFPIPGSRPARHSVVRDLPDGVSVQIEAMGVLAEPRVCYTISEAYHGGIANVPNSLPFGTRVGNVVFSAATYGSPTRIVVDDVAVAVRDEVLTVEEQARIALERTALLLSGAGMSLSDVVHVFAWVSGTEVVDAVTRAWDEAAASSGSPAAFHAVQARLPERFAVQYEIVAVGGS